MNRRVRLSAASVALVLTAAACGSTVQVPDTSLQSGGLLPPGAVLNEDGVVVDAAGNPVLGGSDLSGAGAVDGELTLTSPGSSAPGGASTGATTSAPSTGGSGGPSGTAPGVTDDTISIGILTIQGFGDFAAQAGFNASTGNQTAQAKKFIEYLNARGGIAGREIVPVFHDLNVVGLTSNPSSEYQAACAKFTEDNEVYAVASPVATLGDSLYECLTNAGVMTASAGEAVDATYLQRFANTLYLPVDVNLTRILANNVHALYDAGWFGKDPVIGVVRVDNDTEERAVADGLVPALAEHGLQVEETFAAAEGNAGSNQYGNAVLQMRSAGVTHVLFSFLGSALLFGQSAANQDYYPKLGLHSRQSPGALLQTQMSARSLEGAMGIGWQQYNDVDSTRDPGPTERGSLCLQLMKDAGEDVSNRVTALIGLWQCDALFFLDSAIEAAPDFSLPGFRAGAESLTSYPVASTFSGGIRPGEVHDGARTYRLNAFNSQCKCFQYVSGPRPLR